MTRYSHVCRIAHGFLGCRKGDTPSLCSIISEGAMEASDDEGKVGTNSGRGEHLVSGAIRVQLEADSTQASECDTNPSIYFFVLSPIVFQEICGGCNENCGRLGSLIGLLRGFVLQRRVRIGRWSSWSGGTEDIGEACLGAWVGSKAALVVLRAHACAIQVL
jgi:hypothetical protein